MRRARKGAKTEAQRVRADVGRIHRAVKVYERRVLAGRTTLYDALSELYFIGRRDGITRLAENLRG